MENNKKLKYVLWGILIIALLLRVCFVVNYGSTMFLGDFTSYNNDDVKYIRSGQILLTEHKFVYRNPQQPTAFIAPGLPMLIAMVFSIFGTGMKGILAFKIVQALIGTGSVALLYYLGKKIFDFRVGLLAAVVYSIEPSAIRNCGYVLTETMFTFLVLLLALTSLKALESHKVKHFMLLGVVWALSSLVRPSIGMYFGVVFIAMFFYKYEFGEVIKLSVITSLMFVAVMSPWWIRNYMQFDRFIPFTASSGNPMILGSFIDNKVIKKDIGKYPKVNTEIETNDAEVNLAHKRISRKFKEEFWKYAYWYTIGKTIYFWKDPFYWMKGQIDWFVSTGKIIAKISHRLILFFGVIGIVMCFAKDFKKLVLPIGIMLYFNVIHLPFFVMSRYSFPVMTIMLLLGSYCIIQIAEMIWSIRARIQN